MVSSATGLRDCMVQHTDSVGKVFQVVGEKAFVGACGQMLTREEAREHSEVACKPPANRN